MSPITVYADAPLHPDGATPKTAAAKGDVESIAPTQTTAVPHDPTAPPPPQPGARPAAPTSATPTTGYAHPPAPQPGAQPSVTATYTTTQTSTMPPPPQFTMPFPSENQAPTHSTQPNPPPSFARPAQFSPAQFGGGGFPVDKRHSIEHPPGYQQNPYAADGTAEDRARFARAQREAQEAEGVMGSMRDLVRRASGVAKELEEGAWKLFNEKAGR